MINDFYKQLLPYNVCAGKVLDYLLYFKRKSVHVLKRVQQ